MPGRNTVTMVLSEKDSLEMDIAYLEEAIKDKRFEIRDKEHSIKELEAKIAELKERKVKLQ